MMIIKKPTIEIQNEYAVYTVKVQLNDTEKTLWYKVNKENIDLISNSADAAVIALLIPAMYEKADILVEGELSEMLYVNVMNRLQVVLKKVIPRLSQIKIKAGNLSSRKNSNKGVATGLSCGVDSFSVLADYFNTDLPKNYQLSHLIFNNVGQHGRDNTEEDAEKRFEQRYSENLEVSNKLGLPLVYINSNLNEFYTIIGLGHLQTHTLRNTSVAHLLSAGISRFYYSSGHSYDYIFIGKSKAISFTDPIILPLLSTDSLEAISVGSEYTRIEKTLKISKLNYTYDSLDVCTKGDRILEGNCSTCEKCLRTQLSLDILGIMDKYNSVFDYEKYYKIKSELIAEVMLSSDPMLMEIRDYIQKSKFKIPDETHKKIRILKRKENKQIFVRNIKKISKWRKLFRKLKTIN